jgi:hypothetical protein
MYWLISHFLEIAMKAAPQQTSTEVDLLTLKGRFEEWRRTRAKLGPTPLDLWNAASSVAKKYGVARVASELRIDYNKLKRLSKHSSPECGQQRTPDFIEVAQPCVSPLHHCEVSIQKGIPDKLHVQIRSTSSIDLATVLNAVWR